ncbi:hypothetical protein ABT247_33155 [Kitasatospora sp. NPDC001539]|uniref:hypothetical protein n=1 Tax=Kitasatospora sp. NPDC001539 TaxID=3154384 RepID=UPI00331945C9
MVDSTGRDATGTPYPTVPLTPMTVPAHEAEARSKAFHDVMAQRRTVRHFATRPIPDGVVEWAVRTAGEAGRPGAAGR